MTKMMIMIMKIIGGQIVDKSDDTGRTDDPVRMYLKKWGM